MGAVLGWWARPGRGCGSARRTRETRGRVLERSDAAPPTPRRRAPGVLPRGDASVSGTVALFSHEAGQSSLCTVAPLSVRQPALDAHLSGAHCESSAGCWGRPQEGTVLARCARAPSVLCPSARRPPGVGGRPGTSLRCPRGAEAVALVV